MLREWSTEKLKIGRKEGGKESGRERGERRKEGRVGGRKEGKKEKNSADMQLDSLTCNDSCREDLGVYQLYQLVFQERYDIVFRRGSPENFIHTDGKLI